MTVSSALGKSALCVVMFTALLLQAGAAPAESPQSRLRKEKARLTEMRNRAEKAASELDKTLKRERAARHKVDATRKQLARQRRLIERIDRKLSALSREMEKAESEVRAIEQERTSAQHRLERAAALAFRREREHAGLVPAVARGERLRYLTTRVLVSEGQRVGRLTADKEEKESALSGIEHQVELSEKRISREKKVGESLKSQRKKEAKRLADIQAQKKKKEKELEALRARVSRMESLVSRIERQAREEERRRSREGRGRGPSKFSAVPGGLVPPVRGKVVGPFGTVRDPVFDVDVENHGVEIEAPSGSPIRSIGKGNVVFSGTVSGFGKVLIIQHGTGLFSVYGKAESFSVSQDQVVAPGQNIGRLPDSPDGKSVLYLELRAAGTAIDPTAVIPLSR